MGHHLLKNILWVRDFRLSTYHCPILAMSVLDKSGTFRGCYCLLIHQLTFSNNFEKIHLAEVHVRVEKEDLLLGALKIDIASSVRSDIALSKSSWWRRVESRDACNESLSTYIYLALYSTSFFFFSHLSLSSSRAHNNLFFHYKRSLVLGDSPQNLSQHCHASLAQYPTTCVPL